MYHAAFVDDAERVARANGVVRLDGRDGHAPGASLPGPPGLVQVFLDLVGVRAAEDEGLVHPRRLQPCERVLDHRHVHQRQQHLGALEGDGAEFEREAVGEEDGLQGRRAREVLMVVAGGASPASAAGFLRHDCCGCGGGEGSEVY